jgi:hypothetical protein
VCARARARACACVMYVPFKGQTGKHSEKFYL